MTKRTIEEYENLIVDWAEERDILKHSTVPAQTLKSASEMGELTDAIAKGEDIRDHVGDHMVTLVLLNRLERPEGKLIECLTDEEGATFENYSGEFRDFDAGIDELDPVVMKNLLGLHVIYRMGQLAHTIGQGFNTKDRVGAVVLALMLITKTHELTLEECLEVAWDEIKDRKGTMVPGGVFVKEG